MKYSEEQIEDILDRVSALLDNYQEAETKWQDEQDHKHWNDTYGERLGAYSDKLKTLNGEDFDIINEARKEHASLYKDVPEDDYVNALEDNIKKVIERVWPEAPKEVKEEVAEQVADEVKENPEEGKVEAHVEAEDKDENGEISADEVETHTLEEKEEPEEEEDPIAKQYREFEEEFKKLPRRK